MVTPIGVKLHQHVSQGVVYDLFIIFAYQNLHWSIVALRNVLGFEVFSYLPVQESLHPMLHVLLVPSPSVEIFVHIIFGKRSDGEESLRLVHRKVVCDLVSCLSLDVNGDKSNDTLVVVGGVDKWLGFLGLQVRFALCEVENCWGLVVEHSIDGGLIFEVLNGLIPTKGQYRFNQLIFQNLNTHLCFRIHFSKESASKAPPSKFTFS